MPATKTPKPKVGAIAPWYGSNRIGAHRVGALLDGCEFVAIPFCGGLCEVQHIAARSILCNDKNHHLINLASIVADDDLRPQLIATLSQLPYHRKTFESAQTFCRGVWEHRGTERLSKRDRLLWAVDYFIASWMARSGAAGTKGEFAASFSMRWDSGGGDSATRFRNAAASLEAHGVVMRRCVFECLDAYDFIERCKDAPRHAIYCDPPFPGPGDLYRHTLPPGGQERLASMLSAYTTARVVCRFYDVPLVRDLYRESDGWQWFDGVGRTQANKTGAEVLIVRNLPERPLL